MPARSRSVLLLAAVFATPAGAQQRLPDVVVSEARPAPDLSTVIGEEIGSALTPALGDLLRRVPGAYLDRSGASGAVSSLYLRGAEANGTAVRLDGVRINDPTNTRGGSVDFATLTAEDVERIEVLRGPASARFGADAMAGAVNVVSARGDGPAHLVAGLGAGDEGYEHGQAALRGAKGRADYALGAAWTDSGRATPGASARLGRVDANLGYAPDAASDLRATLHRLDAELDDFPEDSGGWRHAQRRDLERRGVGAWVGSVSYRRLAARGVALGTRVGYYARDEDDASPGVAPDVRDPAGIPAGVSQNRLDRYDAAATLETRVLDAAVTLGVDGERERGRSDAVLEGLGPASFDRSRDDAAVFAEVDRRVGAVRVEASLRVDAPEGYGRVTTPHLRLSRALGPWTVSASAGEGFKRPSFFALGNPIVGNPDLQPERSRGYELGATRELGRATLSVAAFDDRYRNAVDFDEGPPPRLVNRGAIVSHGGEAGVRWDFGPRGYVRAHVAYADARVEETGARPRNRPPWTGGAQLRIEPFSPVALLAQAAYVGARRDSSIPTGDVEMPATLRLDAGLAWQPLAGVGGTLAVENLLDRDDDELVGFPAARRNVRLSLRLRL